MDKSLKKLSRNELMELLVNLSDECDELIAENEGLKQELAAQRQQRMPRSAKVGSIAQAALEANGYFEVVQRSADDYLREIKFLRDELTKRSEALRLQQEQVGRTAEEQAALRVQAGEQEAHERAELIVQQARQQAEELLSDARNRSREILDRANGQADATVARANKQANTVVARADEEANALMAEARSQAGELHRQAQESQQAISSAETAELFRPRGRHARS